MVQIFGSMMMRKIRIPAGAIPPAPKRSLLPQPDPPWKIAVRVGLLVLAAVAIGALMIDLRRIGVGWAGRTDLDTEIKSLATPASMERLADPNGRFTLALPAGWRVATGRQSAPYSILLTSPNGITIGAMATPVEYDDLTDLFEEIRNRQEESSLAIAPETFRLNDRQAIRRIATLRTGKAAAIDFLENRVAHHIMCRIPLSAYEEYLPSFMEWLASYQPAGSHSEAPSEPVEDAAP